MKRIAHLFTMVQVETVRNCGYAMVSVLNRDGSLARRADPLAVHFPEEVREMLVNGSVWKVTGEERVATFTIGGYTRYETLIDATQVKFVRPSGLLLARWISANVQGIGSVIANRLVRQRKLEKWVAEYDVKSLLTVAGMTEERARRLIELWPKPELYEMIDWLQKQSFPVGLAEKLVRIFGKTAITALEDNPFLLLSAGVGYERVTTLASALGIPRTDNRLLAGTAVHVAAKHSEKTGSTVIEPGHLRDEVQKLVGLPIGPNPGDLAVQQGLMAMTPDGYQVWGSGLMEAASANFIVNALHREPGQGSTHAVWEKAITYESVSAVLRDYEATLPFKLTDEQTNAVIGAVCSPVAVISGGAGTGKTTILRAVLGIYDRLAPALVCFPVALSGRAAKKMSESILLPAQTIAKLIADHLGPSRPDLPSHVLMIIDEASMVDLLSFYRLIGLLPSATRILFVGDTAQLPPVGPGVVFHSLASSGAPFFELSQVKRQSEDSGIHRFASAVRGSQYQMPPVAGQTLADSADCCFVGSDSLDKLTAFWEEAGGIDSSIILSPVRRGGLGVDALNQHFQSIAGSERMPVCYADARRGRIPWITASQCALRLGDPVLVTQNIYEDQADVRNGDLGVIIEVYDGPASDGSLGVVLINDVRLPLSFNLLNALELGYAITIHKAQGSQWPNVFVLMPDYADEMLDASLIYTAATRPTERLILMGNPTSMAKGIVRGSAARKRLVGLDHRIKLATQWRTGEQTM